MFDIKFTIHFKFPELVPSPESAYLRSQMSYRMKILITACKMTLLSFLAVAQTMAQDSVKDSASYLDNNFYNKTQRLTDKIIQSKAFQMTYIGVPLIAGGLIIKHQDNHFLELRNAYAPDLRYPYDDYLTLVPAAAMLGLKVAGVEGRSSWGRMLVSDAFSAALVATAVNTLKYTTKVTRPDGSKQNSFPSGHTAVAFMSATMLHKEYGLTRSPWYSVAGYTWATGIGLSRILNNRHWLSDVLAGAGIGILSTELGYFLADLIFKEKGITHELFDMSAYDYQRPPSFFSLHLGLNKMPTKITLPSGIHLQTTLGSSAGFEGAWFINRTVGFGGRLSATSLPLYPLDQQQAIQLQPLSFISGSAGAYFSYPIVNRLLIGGKLLLGGSYFLENTISEEANDQETKAIGRIASELDPNLITGISFLCAPKPMLGIRLFFDYNLNPFKGNTTDLSAPTDELVGQRQLLHSMTFGGSINVLF